ncbi:MAG: hypothetical protein ABIQ86_01815 [Steroidobacteraceae bacterium]
MLQYDNFCDDMFSNLQENQHAEWPESPEVYEGAFVRTVLSLHGIGPNPSPFQLAKARKVLGLYGLKVATTTIRQVAFNMDAGRGRLSQSAGVEHAFMFVRFDSVLPPDAAQMQEFNDWLVETEVR